MTARLEQKWISGFWRRIVAFLLDVLILGAVGLMLSSFLEDSFVQMGIWGPLVGLFISLMYFGVMNSSVTGGQTLGKKALGIRVVDASNSPITLSKSFLRYAILAIPFFLDEAQFSPVVGDSLLVYPISMILFGGIFSTLYLYVFNRVTRQSLHDLVVGSYVVNQHTEKQALGSVWKVHLIIVAAFFVLPALDPRAVSHFADSQTAQDLKAAQLALSNDPAVSYVTVSKGSRIINDAHGGTQTTTYVKSYLYVKDRKISDADFARKVATIIVANYPEAQQRDLIGITLIYGFDIGIASRQYYFTHQFNPDELTALE
jgi:uncharacterized RDD family membrane protein YckC